MNLPRVRLTAGTQPLDVYVARNEEERSLGLMFRREMPSNEGMLFVCDVPAYQSFWMKDTPLPLSIAYIGDDGTLLQINHMEPQTLDSHRADRPVRYILEVNQGWFQERGVAPRKPPGWPVVPRRASRTEGERAKVGARQGETRLA